ncbi:MAG: right-handed parallel beta-helix repeat-containing protein [Candidatus Buchananbacteria bacterium]|nr:right-handed parallel beta-helix repeat-containing protein [Candidatus Buchananbacteria bacterium]
MKTSKPKAKPVTTQVQTRTQVSFSVALVLSVLAVANLMSVIVSMNRGVVMGDSTTSAATYYVDAQLGLDTNDGLTAATPWQTLAKVSTTALQPGDTVLLRGGSVWNEKLVINASGVAGNPIQIGSYEVAGVKPLINGNDQLDFGIVILGRDYISIKDIAVTRINTGGMAPSAGIAIANSNNIIVDDVEVSNTKGVGGIFIYSSTSGRGENNTIKNSKITDTRASAYGTATGNMGNGIQLWAECATCGKNNTLENNTSTGSGDHGIGVFMPYTTVRNNTVRNNDESGISASNSNAHHTTIDGNTVSGNCQKTDDCFGINLFRAGASNVVKNNSVSAQKDTISDSTIKSNDGYFGVKFGTGGIRFDGGDSTLVNNPAFGVGSDYMSQSGNVISGNTISNEYDAVQVYNYDGVTVSNNNISNSVRWGVNASAMNSVLGNVTPPLELSIVGGVLMAKWGGKAAVTLESITKPITVTIQGNTITGKGVNTSKATVIGDVVPEPTPTPTPTSTVDTVAPVVTLVGGGSVSLTKGQTWADPGYTVTDNIDLSPVVTVTGSININTVGTYVFNYSARDAAGNQSVVVNRTVTVTDVVATCTKATYYRDADGDGKGYGSAQSLCPANATGYVTNNKDCNDSVKATCRSAGYICSKTCYKR